MFTSASRIRCPTIPDVYKRQAFQRSRAASVLIAVGLSIFWLTLAIVVLVKANHISISETERSAWLRFAEAAVLLTVLLVLIILKAGSRQNLRLVVGTVSYTHLYFRRALSQERNPGTTAASVRKAMRARPDVVEAGIPKKSTNTLSSNTVL